MFSLRDYEIYSTQNLNLIYVDNIYWSMDEWNIKECHQSNIHTM